MTSLPAKTESVSSSAAISSAVGPTLGGRVAADFVAQTERKRRTLDVIGLGGALLSGILFAAPLTGLPIPSSIPVGLLVGCLVVFFAGRKFIEGGEFKALCALGVPPDAATAALERYRRARAMIPQGAKTSARHARLAASIVADHDDR